MDYKNPNLVIDQNNLQEGKVRWRSPSNIAIIKYWGKHGVQLPRNPSLSLTLDAAHTDTTLSYRPRQGVDQSQIQAKVYLDGKEEEKFSAKTASYLESLLPIFPFIKQFDFELHTHNSFPHSAGIASSASGMSALALCLCSIEDQFFQNLLKDDDFERKASYVARLGSGSACRSVYGGAAMWGKSGHVENSSDEYALPLNDQIHEVFKTFHDDILLISKKEKSVSSRAGHALMEQNPYADPRYAQARQRMYQLLQAMQQGDLDVFGRICEAEALSLHALMMTSTPPYLLLEGNTIEAIKRLWAFREESGHPVYFTIDAGPNLHLLYPDQVAEPAKAFIRSELLPLCEGSSYIADRVGDGPLQLEPNTDA